MKAAAVWPSAVLGFALGVDAVGHCLAIATLVFSGPLASGLGIGTALFLLSTLVATLALMRWGGLPGTLAIAQDPAVVIVAAATASAAVAVVAQGGYPLPTAIAIIGLATLLSGIAFLLIGRFGLGQIVRTMPYPVTLGFMASSGWLLSYTALAIAAGASGPVGLWVGLQENALILVPMVALALCLMLAFRIWSGAGVLIGVLVVFIFGFYLALAAFGLDATGAREIGLLPEVPRFRVSAGAGIGALDQIDWRQILLAGPSLGIIVLINVLAFFLNTSGAELAMRKDVDMNRELRIAGLTNAFLGPIGGTTSFVSTGSTIIAFDLGAKGRALTLSYCAVVLLGGIFAVQLVAAVPVFVAGGLLLFIGLTMLENWLVKPRKQLVLIDWLIVLAIVAITAVKGLFVAVAAGLVFALLAFVMSYAKLPVMRRNATAQPRRSGVDRSSAEETTLRADWHRVRLARLQGYLFFGSVERLLAEVRTRKVYSEPSGARVGYDWLVLDYSGVTGLDSSTCASLEKLGYLAAARRMNVHICGLSAVLSDTLHLWHPKFAQAFGFDVSATLEEALERIEEALLAEHPGSATERDGLHRLLSETGRGHPRLGELAALFQHKTLADGDVLIKKGCDSRDIHVVEAGRLCVYLDGGEAGPVRVRAFAAGAVVGEVARYLGAERSADVVAVGITEVQWLPAATFDRLERDDRDLAALLHAIVARGLAEKVIRTSQLLVNG